MAEVRIEKTDPRVGEAFRRGSGEEGNLFQQIRYHKHEIERLKEEYYKEKDA